MQKAGRIELKVMHIGVSGLEVLYGQPSGASGFQK